MVATGRSFAEVDAKDVVKNDRYLVRVDRQSKAKKALKPRYYAPYAGVIDAALKRQARELLVNNEALK
jgi:hypothetical protein